MRQKAITLLFIGLLFAGCANQERERLNEQMQRVLSAIEKIGFAGIRSTIVNQGRGRVHDRIEIYLGTNPDVNDESLKHLDGLTGVVGIDLSESPVTNEGLKVLTTLPQLEYVQLCGTAITDDGLKILANCPELRRLDIRQTTTTAKASDILKKFPKLEVVYAKGTALEASELANVKDDLRPYFLPKDLR